MVKRLFETDPELDFCEAKVVSVEKNDRGWMIELDQTVLFPEGGGQLCDKGKIDETEVLDVFESDGRIFHVCGEQFCVGGSVRVSLDRRTRLYHSQQHTGEHILSYSFWKLFDAKNIGFHSDERMVTIDLDTELSREQCAQAEWFANEEVWADKEVSIVYRKRNETGDLSVRKLTDKVEGILRIVVIEEGDVCTCCGTHVKRTGSVGLIKIVGYQRHRGGTRIEAVCGSGALADYTDKTDLAYQISCSLSCGQDTVMDRIETLKTENRSLTSSLRACGAKLMNYAAEEALANCLVANGKKCAMVSVDCDSTMAKKLLNRLLEDGSILAGVFYKNCDRINYMISKTEDIGVSCRNIAEISNGLLNGKGGGSDSFAQGSGKFTDDWQDLVGMIDQAACRLI